MLDFIYRYWLEAFFTMSISVLTVTVKRIYNKMLLDKKNRDCLSEADKEEQELIKHGILSLLHYKLRKECVMHLEAGEISLHDLTTLDLLYSSYAALGGNGTAKELVQRCQTLPLKNEAR